MPTIFLLCAVVGGTVLVCQFVMTLIGLGDSGFDFADDIPDGVDFDVDAADIEVGDAGDLEAGEHHGSTWMFGIVSFRTLVAAATFFGLSGMAAYSGGLNLPLQLLIAVVCGGVAMFVVHWLMRTFYRLGQTGNLRITNAVGKTATVYVPIPGGNAGQGKVQIKLQERLAEYPATTSAEENLATGAKVVVVGVVSGTTLKVEPQHKPVEADA